MAGYRTANLETVSEFMNDGVLKTTLEQPFITESGFRFDQPEIAYKTWGTLNARRDNVVVICHALTGHAAADEWFAGIFGPGRLCDENEKFIICINVPGSSYGSIGPWSVNPKTDRYFKADFPNITIRDMVRFQMLLLDQLDIRGIETVIGGSLGGMQALEFSIMDGRVKSAILMAMGKAHTPWAIGISEAQRAAIYADNKWKDGYYNREEPPVNGLAAARMMAMITYRTPENYQRKFERNLQNEKGQYQVESYLNYQGKKLTSRFDALSYVILTKAMDTHDITRDRSTPPTVLAGVSTPVLVVGVTSDLLYPLSEQQELSALLPNSTLEIIDSEYGHDAFLIEFKQINNAIKQFRQTLQTVKEEKYNVST